MPGSADTTSCVLCTSDSFLLSTLFDLVLMNGLQVPEKGEHITDSWFLPFAELQRRREGSQFWQERSFYKEKPQRPRGGERLALQAGEPRSGVWMKRNQAHVPVKSCSHLHRFISISHHIKISGESYSPLFG